MKKGCAESSYLHPDVFLHGTDGVRDLRPHKDYMHALFLFSALLKCIITYSYPYTTTTTTQYTKRGPPFNAPGWTGFQARVGPSPPLCEREIHSSLNLGVHLVWPELHTGIIRWSATTSQMESWPSGASWSLGTTTQHPQNPQPWLTHFWIGRSQQTIPPCTTPAPAFPRHPGMELGPPGN